MLLKFSDLELLLLDQGAQLGDFDFVVLDDDVLLLLCHQQILKISLNVNHGLEFFLLAVVGVDELLHLVILLLELSLKRVPLPLDFLEVGLLLQNGVLLLGHETVDPVDAGLHGLKELLPVLISIVHLPAVVLAEIVDQRLQDLVHILFVLIKRMQLVNNHLFLSRIHIVLGVFQVQGLVDVGHGLEGVRVL